MSEIIERSINDLIPYEFNNKIHSQEEIDRIANSINEFGWTYPILTDENNVILAGHKRLLAAKKLALDTVPVIRKVGLTDAQKKAYRIIDNKSSQESPWDLPNIDIELSMLEDLDFDIKQFINLDFDLNGIGEDEPEAKEDDFEPEEKPTDIKRGDLIELGRHRVLCGDSTSEDDTRCLMNTESASLVVTDPPYGVDHIGGTKDPRRPTHRTGGVVTNDNLGNAGTEEQLRAALNLIRDASKKGAAAYIASPAGTPLPHFIAAMADSFIFRHSLVWIKHAFVFGGCDYHYRHELVLYGWKDDGAHYFTNDRTQDSVFEFDRGDRNIPHPTSKPLGLFSALIKNSSKQSDIVCDPFLGSGTTLIACEQLNRTCYGIEIEPKYCQVIIDRYKKHCDDNGKTFECKVNGEPYYG